MRILLINQFFWPDSAATSQLLTDVARRLAEQGHEVHALCAASGYAPDDESGKPEVSIHRPPSLPFVRGKLGRLASYASFLVGAAWRTATIAKPDLVLTLTTPPLVSLLGNLASSLRGSKHYIWEMDMYPDVAVDLNYFRAGGLLDRLVGAVADYSRGRADGILALGPCMRDRLVRRGVASSKIAITDNWADSRLITPAAWPEESGPLVTLYSGNLGLAHDVETIAGAMEVLSNDARYRFVFAGGGARRKSLETICSERGIGNVQFLPYSSKTSLGERLGAGHLGLITQQDCCLGSVVPSKVYGLLAAGRPVLFVGPGESTVARIVREHACGWQVNCGDVAGLVKLLRSLEPNRNLIRLAGDRARKAVLDHYDLPLGVARVCRAIGASESEDAEQARDGNRLAFERQFISSS